MPVDSTITSYTQSLAAVHRFYRFTRMRVILLPNNYAANIYVQYVPGGGSSTAGAADDNIEAEFCAFMNAYTTVPQGIDVPRRALVTSQPWFATNGDASDIYLDTMGQVNFESTGAVEVFFKLVIEYEYKDPLPSELGLSALNQLKKENDLLRKAICNSDPAPQPTKRSCLSHNFL